MCFFSSLGFIMTNMKYYEIQPAIGISRMKRWVRANKLGLQPPIEVLAILLKEEERGNSKSERAHVEELMNSKYVIGEA
jgi:DNA polymerase delta subunit 4